MEQKDRMDELFHWAMEVAMNAPDDDECTREEYEFYEEIANLINAMQDLGY